MLQAAEKVQQQVAALLTLPGEAEVHAYYEQVLLQQNSTMTIRPDSGSGKGKGVFAHVAIQDEQTVLQEAPLVAGQHTSNKVFALVCSHCFQFLGSIRMQLAWCKLAALCDGTPPYDLEQLQAIEIQLHQTPFSEQWQMPQPDARMRCTAASIAQQQLGLLTILSYAARQLAQDWTQKALQLQPHPAVATMHLAAGVTRLAATTMLLPIKQPATGLGCLLAMLLP
ncbi:TPA: hypothetical protein ACH3X2_010404 [Trebouxia sp. C0005]